MKVTENLQFLLVFRARYDRIAYKQEWCAICSLLLNLKQLLNLKL